MSKWSDRKVVSEVVQSWTTAVAIVAGGIWAVYTFTSVGEVNRGQAAIADYESRMVSLELTTEMNELGPMKDGRLAVEVIIEIKNNGIFPVDVDLADSETFSFSRVHRAEYRVDEEGVQHLDGLPVHEVYSSKAYNRLTSNAIRSMSSTLVTPGSTASVSYLIPLDEPGLYLSSFISPIPEDVLALMNVREIGDHNEPVTHASAWMTQRYFRVVGESQEAISNDS